MTSGGSVVVVVVLVVVLVVVEVVLVVVAALVDETASGAEVGEGSAVLVGSEDEQLLPKRKAERTKRVRRFIP